MTDVLFTHSYLLRYDPKEFRAMMPYPPLGTLYGAASARRAGYGVSLFDAMLATSAEMIELNLVRESPKFLVIYDDDFNYLTKMCLTRMRQAAFTMARIGRRFGCKVIVHSSDATDHLDKYFDNCVDYVLIGEAEQTICELLDVLSGREERPVAEIPGVAYRAANGAIVRGPKREVLRDLDRLPMPARDLIDLESYRRVWMEHHGYFSLNIVTTRGCPFHCNWCAKPIYGQVYNSHSPQRIAEEMRLLKEELGADHIWFCDDIFGLKPGWVAELSTEVARLDARLPFKCLSRSDLILRENVVDALRSAGCRTVWMGAESGSQMILDAMEKGTRVEGNLAAAERLHAAGIRVGFFLQFGYPGEGDAEIEATLRMLKRAMPEEIGISVSYPLPGTKFHDRVRAEMGEKKNWAESADLAMMFRGTYSTEFYRVLSKFVHKDHRWHQALRAVAALLRGATPSRSALRGIMLAPYYLAMRMVYRVQLGKLRVPQRPALTVMLPVIEAPELQLESSEQER